MTPKTDMLVIEGKTKRVWYEGNNTVRIESKDDITAGDGARRDVMSGKAAWSTATTCHTFECLNAAGIPTHFIGLIDATNFCARLVEMIPVEVVMRRIAFGSYLERHPGTEEGHRFDQPTVEFFEKDDAGHDPLLVINRSDTGEGLSVTRHDAHQPLGSAVLGPYASDESALLIQYADRLEAIGQQVFEVLEAAWAKLGHVLVDLKVEFGLDEDTEELLLADVIDNDSWRVWLKGDPEQMVDKQVYRDLGLEEPEAEQRIKGNYALVAKLTETFVPSPIS